MSSFDSPTTGPIRDQQPPLEEEGQRDAFFARVRDIIGDRETRLVNEEGYRNGGRYLYGFTRADNEPAGFLKMTSAARNEGAVAGLLRRESAAMLVANALEIPTVRVMNAYTETPNGEAILHLEALDAENGETINGAEMIAGAPAEYGAQAARALLQATGKVLPDGVDTSCLKRNDRRNESLASFFGYWDEAANTVLKNLDAVSSLDEPAKERLRTGILEAMQNAHLQLDQTQSTEQEYFVHNDASPNNTFFHKRNGEAMLLDFEYAGATQYRELAELTDVGNMYARMWPNPEMQQKLCSEWLAASPAEERQDTYQRLRTSIVFGTTFLSHFVIKADHREHRMAEHLLRNMEGNLAALEKEYKSGLDQTKNPS